MKPTAFLVNTSRGPVVREDALAAALSSGTIAGAAVDAYDAEPLAANHPFHGLDNLVLSPHLGYVTTDVYQDFYAETVRSCRAYLEGAPIRLLGDAASSDAGTADRRYEDS